MGANISPTEHPRILSSREPCLPRQDLDAVLAEIDAAMTDGSAAAIRTILARAVEDYHPFRRVAA